MRHEQDGCGDGHVVANWKSRVAGAGNVKRARQTFCRGCFGRLPRGMQTDLYKRFGEGYEEAYRAAVKFLGFAPLPWEAK